MCLLWFNDKGTRTTHFIRPLINGLLYKIIIADIFILIESTSSTKTSTKSKINLWLWYVITGAMVAPPPPMLCDTESCTYMTPATCLTWAMDNHIAPYAGPGWRGVQKTGDTAQVHPRHRHHRGGRVLLRESMEALQQEVILKYNKKNRPKSWQ